MPMPDKFFPMSSPSDDSFEVPYYSTEFREKGITKIDFLKIVIKLQEDERARIGHELHDSVNPLLAVANLYLNLIPAKSCQEKLAKEQVSTVIQLAIENVRSISSQMVISKRTNCSIVHLIREMVKMTNGTERFTITFRHSCETRFKHLCPYRKLAVYRILQEQLNNIIKHSQAKKAKIRLLSRGDMLNLSIEDNGIGFDGTRSANGIGFLNMQTRLKEFDGTFEIISAPGKGCKINISLPLAG